MPEPRRRLSLFLHRLSTTLALLGVSAVAMAGPVPPQTAEHEFHFAVLGDSQFHQPLTFNRIVDQVRTLYPAFVIQVGDMIEGYRDSPEEIHAQWRRFRQQIAALAPIRFLPVPGNHDLYNTSREADPELVRIYESYWGDPYYSFDYGNGLFVVLNTDAPGEEKTIGPQQWRWLADTVAGSDAEHIFVFMHRPPSDLANAQRLHELLLGGPVRYVFYGHHHHYHFAERDDIRYVMTNAGADSALAEEAVGSFPHFLQVSVRDDVTSLAVIRGDGVVAPDFVHPSDNYDMYALSRRLAPATVNLREIAEGRYELHIPLENPTSRTLQLYVSCSSADNRWRFDPRRQAPLTLPPQSGSSLTLVSSFEPDRVPESEPTCEVRLPFQKSSGAWLDYQQTVRGLRDGVVNETDSR